LSSPAPRSSLSRRLGAREPGRRPRRYVQLTAKALIGVAAADGKFLWRYDRPANRQGINCSIPVYQDGLLFAASTYGAGGGLVKLSKDASGGIKAEEVYATKKMQNHHGGMVNFDGCLYGLSRTGRNTSSAAASSSLIAATRRPGRTRSLPTAKCTCATRMSCSATT